MKSTLTLAIVTILFLHLTPSIRAIPGPLLINPTSDSAISDVLSSFQKEFEDIGGKLFESSLQNNEDVTKSINDLTNEFAENVDEFAKTLTESIRQHLEKSLNDLISTVSGIRYDLIRYIQQATNRIKNQALQRANQALHAFEDSISHLQGFIEQVRQKINIDIQRTQTTILTSWKDWANRQLAIVARRTNDNMEVLATANSVLSEFINRYGNYLTSCSDEFITQAQLYEDDIQETIDKYVPLVNSLGQEIQNCAQSNNDIKSVEQCRRYIDVGIRELNTACNDFKTLSHDGLQLVLTSFEQRTCVVETLRAVFVERVQIEKYLIILIERGVTVDNDQDDDDDIDSNTESPTESPSENFDVDLSDNDSTNTSSNSDDS